MVCLNRPNHFTFFKGCLPQILHAPFLNALPKLIKTYDTETDTENVLQNTETYLGPCPTSKMELFTKIVNSQKALFL